MGSAISAVTSAVGGVFQGYEANKSRQAAGQAYNQGVESLQGSENQSLGYLNPYLQAGNSALGPLTGLLTGNQYDPKTGQSTALTNDQRNNLYYQDPGYQFALQQGQQGLQKSQIAQGINLSGGAQKELASYLSGSASQYSNNYINQLQNLAQSGQNAANASSGVVGQFGPQIAGGITNAGLTNANYYAQLGNIGAATASQIGAAFNSQPQSLLGGGGGNNSTPQPYTLASTPYSNFTAAGNGQYNQGQVANSAGGYLSPNTTLQYNPPIVLPGGI